MFLTNSFSFREAKFVSLANVTCHIQKERDFGKQGFRDDISLSVESLPFTVSHQRPYQHPQIHGFQISVIQWPAVCSKCQRYPLWLCLVGTRSTRLVHLHIQV